ncbi:MAG TPA: hypothetical protein VIF82_17220 [Burkholderiaceae bacterium]|jgi:hypothetical protein
MNSKSGRTMMLWTLLLLPALAFANDATSNHALNWIGDHLRESIAKSDRDRAALTDAQSAIARANAAVSLSQRYQDSAAESVAMRALETALHAKELAELNLTRHEEAAHRLESALHYAGIEHTGAVAVRLVGKVLIKHHGDDAISTWDGQGILAPGDTLTLGSDAKVQLAVIDGGWLSLGPDSTFTFSAPDKSFWTYDLTGKIHYIRAHGADVLKPPVKYRGAGSVITVRGTEFEMNSANGHPEEFTLIDGKMNLESTATAKSRSMQAWWLTPDKGWQMPAEGSLARVSQLQGAVEIQDASGKIVPATQDAILKTGDQIKSGADGLVILDVADHYRIALFSNSRLESVTEKNSGRPLYALREGRLHVWGNGKPGPIFLTPNTVTTPAAQEFEITIVEGGLAQYVMIDGAVEITAVQKRANITKINPWWDN